MSFFFCIGKKDRYGDKALNSGGTHIYKDFRFRDPWTPDVGRTKYSFVVPSFTDEIFLVQSTNYESDPGITKYTDVNGLVWKLHDGNKPDDTQFTRHPHNYNIDSRPDRESFGVQAYEKSNGTPVSTNEGYIISSSWKTLRERGILQ